jgi:hypothetical protein
MDEQNPTSMATLIAPDNVVPRKGLVTFKVALQQLNFTSVFDVIREPKAVFVRKIGQYSDADAGQAYDNAMSYAVQIGRLFREYQTSTGKTGGWSGRTGIRSLVSLGATWQNLFKEQWDDFCSVGAIAAVDSPVAYASHLYRFIGEIEKLSAPEEGVKDKRVLLDKRRPDLKTLLIDEHSTFTPISMLDIVIDTLSKNVRAYLDTTPDKDKSLYEVMADRRYPFTFPYNLYHQQCLLGLADKKLRPGELNYRISPLLPLARKADNQYGQGQNNNSTQAQCLLSGLSPQQQQLLIAPSLFTTFYLGRDELTNGWKGPHSSIILPLQSWRSAYLVPSPQPAITSVTPSATATTNTFDGTNVAITKFSKTDASDVPVSLNLNSANALIATNLWQVNHLHGVVAARRLCLSIKATEVLPSDNEGYSASFHLITAPHDTAGTALAPLKQSFTLTLDSTYQFTAAQQGFFEQSYGVTVHSPNTSLLAELPTFMQHTGLNAEHVEMLLSRRTHAVRLSPNVPSTSDQQSGTPIPPKGEKVLPYPHASHYGACYVNGTGSGNYDSLDAPTAESIQKDQFDNAMDLVQHTVGELTSWHITKTSPDRLDRLQRMIRLQRWLDIPFAQLDTLVISAIRAEGADNPGLELNTNTLRTVGVYQYLNDKYGIAAEQFAAFLHHLSPYATGKHLPLFDQVFNRVQLFDTPLVLDQTAFTVDTPNPASQKTLLQLCAGLGLQPSEDALFLLVRQTLKDLKTLKRDLQTLSSIYRQARVAQLFGLSAADTLNLAHLLGGDAYRTCLSTGLLAARNTETDLTPDILDVLMQMDWAVDWLKDSQQNVPQLRHLLGLDADTSPMPVELLARLARFQRDSANTVVTAQQLNALGLPMHEDNADPNKPDPGVAIDWFKVLQDEKGAAAKQPLIDPQGLVVVLPLEQANDPLDTLAAMLTIVVGRLNLKATGLKEQVVEKLHRFVASALERQVGLISNLLHDTQKLSKERSLAVIAWAGTSVNALLNEALKNPDAPSPALISLYVDISRHAEASQALKISNDALTLFLLHPSWLGSANEASTKPTLAQLYLLERFGHWCRTQHQPENVLLGYFNLTNPPAPALKNKTLRQTASESANAALARLLEWDEQQIQVLTDTLLPEKRATTMAQVDWIRRCQAGSRASGLSTDGLLQTTALTAQSPFANWKQAGETIIAASRPQTTLAVSQEQS